MRNLILVTSLTVLLVGCNLFPQKYDNNEFLQTVGVTVAVELLLASCRDEQRAKANTKNLLIKTREFEIYSKYTPDNKEVYEIAKILAEDAKQFAKKKHNATYCKIKADLMHKKAMELVKVIPQKKRD